MMMMINDDGLLQKMMVQLVRMVKVAGFDGDDDA